MPAPDFHNYDAKVERAAGRVDTAATDAQREALNYRHGVVHVHGLTLMIEHPEGSVRTGRSASGHRWARRMKCHYGRIKRTIGLDGEPVDVFLGPHPASQLVFVINQLAADGSLDEFKTVLGTRNLREAKDLYLAHYPDGWERTRVGEIRGMLMSDFKEWLTSPMRQTRKKKAIDGSSNLDDIGEALAEIRGIRPGERNVTWPWQTP